MPKEKRRKQSFEKRKPKEIDPKDIQGLKYFKVMRPFLKRLRDVGTERDRAQNRQLRMDENCILVLLWLFSPIVDSLRGLQQASQLKKIQKRFKLPQSSLGSLSESVRIFDPEPLKQIAAELAEQLPEPVVPKKLEGVEKKIVAVDGSFVPILARIARLAWTWRQKDQPTCGYRLHTHFEILRGLPKRIETTPANPKGADAEQAVLERTIEPDHCYVVDRGYQKYALWNKIHAIGSNYVCRIRDGAAFSVVEQREVTPEATAAKVITERCRDSSLCRSDCVYVDVNLHRSRTE